MPRPSSRENSTDLTRDSVVYFHLRYAIDNVQEDRNDPESPLHDLAKELWADPNKSNDLERQALAELRKMFGVPVWTEGTGDDSVDCKVPVHTWYDVKKLWDAVQRHVVGGDDVLGLETPYMEPQGFVLYPQGVNGPRFGLNERDGTIEEWLDAHTPSVQIEDAPPVHVPDGTLVASWPDGLGLYRVVGPDPDHLLIGKDKVCLELWTEEGRTGKLLVDHLNDEGFSILDFVVAAGANQADLRRRLCWFIVRNSPEAVMNGPIRDRVVGDLGLPRRLPGTVEKLLSEPTRREISIDADARRAHTLISNGDIPGRLDLFQQTMQVLGGRDPQEDDKHGLSFRFESVEGNVYWMFHGLLSGPNRPDRSRSDNRKYVPDWVVGTDWFRAETEASWYVVDDQGDEGLVIGAGRSPVEALQDVPMFVWPGRKDEWDEKHLRPGQLVFDPEVHLLLGEWPPVFWDDARFTEFVRTSSG